MSDEARMIRFAVRVAAAFGLFIVALWALATFRPGYREIEFELPQELIDARARWLANPMLHYRLTVRRYSNSSLLVAASAHICQQEFQIDKETVTDIVYDDCSGVKRGWPSLGTIEPTLTVTDLFEKLADETTTVRFLHDAACGDLEVLKTFYHPQFGYPQRIDYVEERASPQNMGWATHTKYRGNSTGFSCLANYIPTRGHVEIVLTALP